MRSRTISTVAQDLSCHIRKFLGLDLSKEISMWYLRGIPYLKRELFWS